MANKVFTENNTNDSEEESTQNGVGIFYTFWQDAPTNDDSRTIPSADIPNNHSEKIPTIPTRGLKPNGTKSCAKGCCGHSCVNIRQEK